MRHKNLDMTSTKVAERATTKERASVCTVLALTIAIVLYAPLRFGFLYPCFGDDTAHHIARLQNITADISLVGSLPYYGNAVLLPFTAVGLSPTVVHTWFVYATPIAVALTLWLILKGLYGWQSALVAIPIVVLITPAIWTFMASGTVFGVFNLFVLYPLGLHCFYRWYGNAKKRWLLFASILLVTTSLFHGATYLVILVSTTLFAGTCGLCLLYRRRFEHLKRFGALCAILSISVLVAKLTWWGQASTIQEVSTASLQLLPIAPYTPPPTFWYWLTHHLGVGTTYLFAISVLLLVLLAVEHRTSTKLLQPSSWLLALTIFVVGIGTFTSLGYDSYRLGLDLGILVSIGVSVLLGVALTLSRPVVRSMVATVLVILVVLGIPMKMWFGDYTALRPPDIQAVEYLNSLPGDVEVATTYQVSTWILELYTNEHVKYTRTNEPLSNGSADYLLYRNVPMTYQAEHDGLSKKDWGPTLSGVNNLREVWQASEGNTVVRVYEVLK